MSNWTAAALVVGTGATAVALAHQSFHAAASVAGTAGQAAGAGTSTGTAGTNPQTASGPPVSHSVATTTASGVTVTTTTHTVNGKTVVTQVRQVPAHGGRLMRATAPTLTCAAPWQRVPTGDDVVAVAERAALGTSARVAVWPPENLSVACAAVDDVLAALDQQASRFREDSELSWLNAAGGGIFMLSDGLAEAVGVALAAARWTGGRADPTVGDALISLGYDRDFAAIDLRRGEPPGTPAPAPGWHLVQLDGRLLRLPSGVRLDLGATAKGLGSDRAVRAVMSATAHEGGVLVSLGGDIAVAGTPPRDGWPVTAAEEPDHAGPPGRSWSG